MLIIRVINGSVKASQQEHTSAGWGEGIALLWLAITPEETNVPLCFILRTCASNVKILRKYVMISHRVCSFEVHS